MKRWIALAAMPAALDGEAEVQRAMTRGRSRRIREMVD